MKKVFAIIILLTVLLFSACNSREVPNNSNSGTDFQQTEVSTETSDDETMMPENVTNEDNNPSSQHNQYNKAILLLHNGNYEESLKLFLGLRGYRDSNKYISDFKIYCDKKIETRHDGLVTTHEYSYDKAGNMVKDIVTFSTGNVGTVEYSYDKDGNVVKIVDINKTYRTGTITYELSYDTVGNMVKEVYTTSDGDVATITCFYDNAGNRVKDIRTSFEDGTATGEYSYDKNGNIVREELYYDSDGSMQTLNHSYDNAGNRVKSVGGYSNGAETHEVSWEYSYDTVGNMVKKVYTHYDGEVSINEYSYNDYGNIVKEVETDSDGTIRTSYEYQYFGERVVYKP